MKVMSTKEKTLLYAGPAEGGVGSLRVSGPEVRDTGPGGTGLRTRALAIKLTRLLRY